MTKLKKNFIISIRFQKCKTATTKLSQKNFLIEQNKMIEENSFQNSRRRTFEKTNILKIFFICVMEKSTNKINQLIKRIHEVTQVIHLVPLHHQFLSEGFLYE